MADLEDVLTSIPNGEGAAPDGSGTAAPDQPEGEQTALVPAQETKSGENTDPPDPNAEPADEPDKPEEQVDLTEKVKAASQDQPDDSSTIRELRGLLRQ